MFVAADGREMAACSGGLVPYTGASRCRPGGGEDIGERLKQRAPRESALVNGCETRVSLRCLRRRVAAAPQNLPRLGSAKPCATANRYSPPPCSFWITLSFSKAPLPLLFLKLQIRHMLSLLLRLFPPSLLTNTIELSLAARCLPYTFFFDHL